MTQGKVRAVWVCALLVGVAAAVLAIVGASAGAQQSQAAVPAAVMRVAVVDMTKVLQGSQQWRDAVEERARLVDTMKRTLNKLARQTQLLRNEYETLAPGTEERQSKAAEIEKALQEFQQTRLELEGKIAEQHEESVHRLFAKLNRVVSVYATEHGISLVLKKQDFQLAGPQSAEQSLQMATADVLYADAALDISEPIVAALNAEYAAPIEVK